MEEDYLLRSKKFQKVYSSTIAQSFSQLIDDEINQIKKMYIMKRKRNLEKIGKMLKKLEKL